MNDFARELAVAQAVIARCVQHLTQNRARVVPSEKIAANGLPELVTNLDLELNERAIADILLEFPNDSVIGEEGRVGQATERYWLLDPIDGTRSFVDDVVGSAIVLSLVVREAPRLSVVHDISNAQTFTITDRGIVDQTGETVGGASAEPLLLWNPYLDDVKLYEALTRELGLVGAVQCESTSLRALSIAAGKGNVLVSLPRSSKLWDSAAAIQILAQCGGTYTDFVGKPIRLNPKKPVNMRGAVASRGIPHKRLLTAVRPWLHAK